jgi:hypothetical protein
LERRFRISKLWHPLGDVFLMVAIVRQFEGGSYDCI